LLRPFRYSPPSVWPRQSLAACRPEVGLPRYPGQNRCLERLPLGRVKVWQLRCLKRLTRYTGL
jgi:hypothetical protein